MGKKRRVVIANSYLVTVAVLVVLFPHPIWFVLFIGSLLLFPLGGGLANLGYRHWGKLSLVGIATFAVVTGALMTHQGQIEDIFGAVYVVLGVIALSYLAVKWAPEPRAALTVEDRQRRRQNAFRAGGALGLVVLVTWGFFAIVLTVDYLFRGRWQLSPIGLPLLPLLLLGIVLVLLASVSERRASSRGA